MSVARLAKNALKIPNRIERGPIDILKALASTVKYIPTEPEPSLQDDPFLLPIRPADRGKYILAKLSGIKTAKFLLNKHPEMFYRDDAEPKVESFMPMEEFSPDMEFTEDDIKWCIENNNPANGVIAYNSLQEKNIKLTDETLLQFFEMMCHTNEEKLVDLIDFEKSRFFPDSEEQLVNLTWKTSGLASKIFNRIKVELDPPRVYSAMIAGLSKFNEHATANEVFDEFKESNPNKGLYTVAYDGLIRSVPRLNSSVTTAHQAVDEIVKHMEENLVMPDLKLFNSILICYRYFQCDEDTCQKAIKLINDMRTLNIDPSLFTYSAFIGVMCRYKSGRVYGDLIRDILSYIGTSNASFVVRDDRDKLFLSSSMYSIANQLNDLGLANMLHKIYLKNPNLFGTQRQRVGYLNNYFKLIITTDSLENSLKFYDSNVPMNFRPSPDCYEALAEALDLYQASEDVIKKIGQDLIEFRVAQTIKNDAIFRKDPSYVNALESSI